MNVYEYSGPVLMFDKIVATNWTSGTVATSEKKARSNLVYQYKRENGLANNAKISLTGKIKIKEDNPL